MASLFNWFWGAFAKPDSRNETDNTAKQQQSESLPQTSRKRRLEDQDDGALEPNKKALLHRLEGSPLLESDLDDSLLNGHRYINPDVDFIDGHVNGRSDDPEDLPAKDYAESQLSDELFIKKEEELEYLHRAEPHWPVSDDDASDSIFATPERQTRDTILHDQLQSSVTKRLWLERHLADRAKETDLLRDQGFSADTISIHRRIGLRGIIPTFPRIWAYDLDTLAQKHFVDDPDPSAAFISSLSGNEFRGKFCPSDEQFECLADKVNSRQSIPTTHGYWTMGARCCRQRSVCFAKSKAGKVDPERNRGLRQVGFQGR